MRGRVQETGHQRTRCRSLGVDTVEQKRALVKFALSIALSPILSQKLSSGEANTLDSTNCVLLPHNAAPRPDRQRINVSADMFTNSTGPA